MEGGGELFRGCSQQTSIEDSSKPWHEIGVAVTEIFDFRQTHIPLCVIDKRLLDRKDRQTVKKIEAATKTKWDFLCECILVIGYLKIIIFLRHGPIYLK